MGLETRRRYVPDYRKPSLPLLGLAPCKCTETCSHFATPAAASPTGTLSPPLHPTVTRLSLFRGGLSAACHGAIGRSLSSADFGGGGAAWCAGSEIGVSVRIGRPHLPYEKNRETLASHLYIFAFEATSSNNHFGQFARFGTMWTRGSRVKNTNARRRPFSLKGRDTEWCHRTSRGHLPSNRSRNRLPNGAFRCGNPTQFRLVHIHWHNILRPDVRSTQ
ncbi:uncharacterized protein BDZ83DRAFT_58206 [Colletotrichum acutatum]|uniref:Uncharacterized protein n=1 Tax=Glomerella acutata TaxID=27357 RepID=A0AAD8XBH8_GLOAC|nr:uncharacterized protein BDZ83DRAFT_58206 [Colletotrichum acutatum]KAK1715063.1 hypothetical protein BDZ83DRAFT_58206 [Colletotrichum acutatum]